MISSLTFRPEREAEFPAIYELVKVAFQTAKVSSGDEQDYVDRLRAGDTYIPDLALVAEADGRVVAHVMLTHVAMRTDDERTVRTLLLAPLSVELAYRGLGVGGMLTREVLRRARERGFEAVFLVGDPKYYCRVGFRPASEYGVEYTGKISPEFVLAIELRPGGLGCGSINVE